ncbi:MAG TPA: hypothetical protein VGL79_05980 [Solirubrobacteraceae bacterium]
MLPKQVAGKTWVAGANGVSERTVKLSMLDVPSAGAEVRLDFVLRIGVAQLAEQHVAQQPMKAIALVAAID